MRERDLERTQAKCQAAFRKFLSPSLQQGKKELRKKETRSSRLVRHLPMKVLPNTSIIQADQVHSTPLIGNITFLLVAM
jgi:hypothetical protein